MMALFGNRKTPAKSGPQRTAKPRSSSGRSKPAPTDTVARLLRILGKYSFDTTQTSAKSFAALAERWATHALTGLPENPLEPTSTQSTSGAPRRLAELTSWFEKHRVEELATIHQTRRDLKRIVGECIGGFRRILGADASNNSNIEKALAALELASARTAPVDLPGQVSRTVATIRASMAARQSRVNEELRDLTQELEAAQASLEVAQRRAGSDALTGLLNRGTFDDHLNTVFARANPEQICLIMIDLDHFKQVNDTWGHPGGDQTLRHVSKCLTRTFPRRGDVVARYGGEEFAVLLHGVDAASAQRLATRLVTNIRALVIPFEKKCIFVTASVGYTILKRVDTASSFVKRADKALYQAKMTGRDGAVML